MTRTNKIAMALLCIALLAWAGQAWATDYGHTDLTSVENPLATSTTAAGGGSGAPFGTPPNLLSVAWPAGFTSADSGIVYLRGTADTTNTSTTDTHQLANVTFPTAGTAKVFLGKATTPAGGSINLRLYTGGTNNVANPVSDSISSPGTPADNQAKRVLLESLWKQARQPGASATTGFYLDGTVTNTAENGLGMRIETDSFGAKYVALKEMLIGDISTQGIGGTGKVNSFDVTQAVNFLNKNAGYVVNGVTYNYFTWLEGDVTTQGIGGAGKVNSFDITAIVNHLNHTYSGANGDLTPIGAPTGVPEPSTWAMIISGIFGMFCVRRLTRLQRSVK